jgi:hypothetical protein
MPSAALLKTVTSSSASGLTAKKVRVVAVRDLTEGERKYYDRKYAEYK